ncbi:alcohol dehydrogenase [Rhodanobacter sp. B04]|uniref:c-type cytochrome n=1 Tax=Rhodanobacter sp. B04 TaxID=1945860 RepID=UPI0009843107|nr:cytochrome c [Rhodanobacter sp. B04]OOG61358.1 alcohol dehydrogenase [Rhodanobacter sp. B04]
MKWLRRLLLLIAILVLLLVGWLFFGGGHQPTSPAMSKVTAATLHDPALIARGGYLVKVGDCAGCHTAQGGAAFAGGRLLATPFGNIPVPNITPDRDTGLGDWSFEDFWQALHAGKGRHGELLYPAFSYTSYTKVTHDDALAMFAYLQSLPAVHQTSRPLMLDFPYSVRNSVAAWRALYFKEGVFQPDPQQTAQWNRGAYLVQGLGHCNECHAARDSLGGTPQDMHLTGGQIPLQNWYAPDLSTRRNGGLHGWSEQDIVDLLKTGQSAKGTAFGPMADVVAGSTQHMSDDDLRAVATYLGSLPARPPAAEEPSPFNANSLVQQGEKIYTQHCADCHGKDGNGVAGIYPPLDGNSSVTEPSGINATRAVLLGGFAPLTAANPRPYSMPPFAQQLSDAEVAAVVSYIRGSWTNKAAVVPERDVSKDRQTPID